MRQITGALTHPRIAGCRGSYSGKDRAMGGQRRAFQAVQTAYGFWGILGAIGQNSQIQGIINIFGWESLQGAKSQVVLTTFLNYYQWNPSVKQKIVRALMIKQVKLKEKFCMHLVHGSTPPKPWGSM